MKLKTANRLFMKFKKSKLHIGKKTYNVARHKLQKWLLKKRKFSENKFTKSIGKPKDLWKVLRPLGLPSKTSSCEINALKIKNTVECDVNSVLEVFRSYYSTLVENLVKMLPKSTIKYSIKTVIKYYEHMILGDCFNLASVLGKSILTILKAFQFLKAASIDNLYGRFLKDGAKVLSSRISDI